MRAFVFGDAARAPRTLRTLAASGIEVADELRGPIWLVRAGAWPASTPAEPGESATGLPLCAVGRVRAPHGEPASEDVRAWDHALARTGGDLAGAWRSVRGRAPVRTGAGPGAEVPPIASAYLDARATRILADSVSRGQTLHEGLGAIVQTGDLRVVRVPALDVHVDPGLRVAEVTTSFQHGGAERIVIDLTAALRARDVAVLPVSLGRPTRKAFDAPAGTLDLSDLRGDRGARAAELVRAVNLFGADVLHAHLLDGDDLRRLAPSGIPVAVTVHNARGGWPEGFAAIEREDAALLIACSRAAEADIAASALPVPARVVWNGIDARTPRAGSRRAWRAKLGVGEDDLLLLAVANPRAQKRLHLLPRIAREVEQRARRGTHLVFAGGPSPASRPAEGPVQVRTGPRRRTLQEELAAAIDRSGMEGRTHLLGSVDDVSGLYAAADVLVAPSAYEGLSLAHLEALAAELPVVTSDVGGAREVAQTARGMQLVAPSAETSAYADAVLRAVDLGRGAALPESFTTVRMTERYVELLDRAARRATSAAGEGALFVTNNFSVGGAQSSLRRLALGLAARGVRVRVAVLEEREDHPTPGLVALRSAGIPVFVAPTAGSCDPLVTARAIAAFADDEPPRAVLFLNVVCEHKLLIADALYDVPLFDASPGEMFFSSLERYFARPRPGLPYLTPRDYGARLAGAIVKYEAEGARAREVLGAPVHVIANGVPLEERATTCARANLHGRVVIGTCARISPQKKLEQLVDALRAVHAKMPPYEVRVAGGPERGCDAYFEELRARAAGLPFEWLGERADTRSVLASLDLFAMVSEPAGCPNASLEAMAARLPVLATDAGGASEQVVDGVTGRLVPRGDPRALGYAIADAALDRARLVVWGRAGRARAEALFSLDRMVADYARVLGLTMLGK